MALFLEEQTKRRSALGLVVVGAVGIHWEPAFHDTLALLEKLEYRPETGAGDDAQDSRPYGAGDEERDDARHDTSEGESPPASGSEIVFGLYDYRVETSNDEKRRDTYYEAIDVDFHIVVVNWFT